MAESEFLKCSCQKCSGHIEFPVTGIGATVNCPHCGAQTTLTQDSPAVGKPKRPPLLVSGVILFVLIIGAVVAGRYWPKKQKETLILPTKPPVQVESPKEPPPPALPRSDSRNDFSVGKISLQKTEGSGLVYAVGSVKNALDRQRFGVKIELNLLDEQDHNIGVVSDYISVIEAHKEWQFKALLTQPNTIKVTVANITEQQ